MRLPRLAERIFNTPLLIEPGKLATILHVLGPRLGTDSPDVPPEFLAKEVEKRELLSADNGIAVIDISGSLVNRTPRGVNAQSGLVSYEEIGAAIGAAVADKTVDGIVLRMDSGGGEVAGIVSLAERIAAAAEKKPVWASVDDRAFSAAYWIASSANRVYLTPTGGVGSIGSIAKHVDKSEFNKQVGVKVTTVYSGARKNDFSSDDPLSAEALQVLKQLVDEATDQFVDAVAKNRRIAKKAVRSTEAGLFFGQKAIDAGLADKLGDFGTVVEDMRRMLARGTRDDAPAVITPRKSEERGRPDRFIEERQRAIAEIRATDGEEPQISGHLAVFGQRSVDMGGFVETIAPGAFAKTIAEADIHHYFNHDGNIVLGRNKSGTLRLREDEQGLFFENDPPNTQTVRDLVLEPIRRGDIDQGSFAFRAIRQEWGKQDGVLTRTLHEVALYHTAIVPAGAYPQTDVGLRASASGIDFNALAAIEAKRLYGLLLTEQEAALLTSSIAALQGFTVAPGVAAHHPTEPTAKPPDLQALRRRLELSRRAYVPLLSHRREHEEHREA